MNSQQRLLFKRQDKVKQWGGDAGDASVRPRKAHKREISDGEVIPQPLTVVPSQEMNVPVKQEAESTFEKDQIREMIHKTPTQEGRRRSQGQNSGTKSKSQNNLILSIEKEKKRAEEIGSFSPILSHHSRQGRVRPASSQIIGRRIGTNQGSSSKADACHFKSQKDSEAVCALQKQMHSSGNMTSSLKHTMTNGRATNLAARFNQSIGTMRNHDKKSTGSNSRMQGSQRSGSVSKLLASCERGVLGTDFNKFKRVSAESLSNSSKSREGRKNVFKSNRPQDQQMKVSQVFDLHGTVQVQQYLNFHQTSLDRSSLTFVDGMHQNSSQDDRVKNKTFQESSQLESRLKDFQSEETQIKYVTQSINKEIQVLEKKVASLTSMAGRRQATKNQRSSGKTKKNKDENQQMEQVNPYAPYDYRKASPTGSSRNVETCFKSGSSEPKIQQKLEEIEDRLPMMMVKKHSQSTKEMECRPFKSKLKQPTPLRQLVQNSQEYIQTQQSDDKDKFIVFEDTFNKICHKLDKNATQSRGDSKNPSDIYSNMVPNQVRMVTEGNEHLLDGKALKQEQETTETSQQPIEERPTARQDGDSSEALSRREDQRAPRVISIQKSVQRDRVESVLVEDSRAAWDRQQHSGGHNLGRPKSATSDPKVQTIDSVVSKESSRSAASLLNTSHKLSQRQSQISRKKLAYFENTCQHSLNQQNKLISEEPSYRLEYSNDGKSDQRCDQKRGSVFRDLTEQQSMVNAPYSDQNMNLMLENKMNFLNQRNSQSSFLHTANFNSRKTANSREDSRTAGFKRNSSNSARSNSRGVRQSHVESKLDQCYIAKIRRKKKSSSVTADSGKQEVRRTPIKIVESPMILSGEASHTNNEQMQSPPMLRNRDNEGSVSRRTSILPHTSALDFSDKVVHCKRPSQQIRSMNQERSLSYQSIKSNVSYANLASLSKHKSRGQGPDSNQKMGSNTSVISHSKSQKARKSKRKSRSSNPSEQFFDVAKSPQVAPGRHQMNPPMGLVHSPDNYAGPSRQLLHAYASLTSVNNIDPLLRQHDAVHFDQLSTPAAVDPTPHATASKDSVENKNIMGDNDDVDRPDIKGIVIVDQEGQEVVRHVESQPIDRGLLELQERLKGIQTTKLERIEEMMRRHERRRKASRDISEDRLSLQEERRGRTPAEKLTIWGATSSQKAKKSPGAGKNSMSQKQSRSLMTQGGQQLIQDDVFGDDYYCPVRGLKRSNNDDGSNRSMSQEHSPNTQVVKQSHSPNYRMVSLQDEFCIDSSVCFDNAMASSNFHGQQKSQHCVSKYSDIKLKSLDSTNQKDFTMQDVQQQPELHDSDLNQQRANRFKRSQQQVSGPLQLQRLSNMLDAHNEQLQHQNSHIQSSTRSAQNKKHDKCQKYKNILRTQKDQLTFIIQQVKEEKIENTLRLLTDQQQLAGRPDVDHDQLHQTRLATLTKLTKDINELESAFLEEKYNLLRQSVYAKYLKLRFLKALRRHSNKNKKVVRFQGDISYRHDLQRKYICFLSLKRHMFIKINAKQMMCLGQARTAQQILRALKKHVQVNKKIREIEAKQKVTLLSKYFLALDYYKNCALEYRQKMLLSDDFRSFKLKQRAIRSLQYGCRSGLNEASFNMPCYVPADHEIRPLLQMAHNFRRFILLRGFFMVTKNIIADRAKNGLAQRHYYQRLAARTLYLLTWAKNQSQIEKNERVRALRMQKQYSLKVKAYSGLLFHSMEMKRLKIERRKYRFFRQNVCFRAWTQYVQRRQESRVKITYFRTRWNLQSLRMTYLQWKYIHRRNKNCKDSLAVVKRENDFVLKARLLSRWREQYIRSVNRKKALMFKCFRKLKKHMLRREKANILMKVEDMAWRSDARLAYRCMLALARRVALKRQYFQLRERCQLKQQNNLKLILLKMYQLYQANRRSRLQENLDQANQELQSKQGQQQVLSQVKCKNSELQKQYKNVQAQKQRLEEQIKGYQVQLQEILNLNSALQQKVKIQEQAQIKTKSEYSEMNNLLKDAQKKMTDKRNEIDQVQVRIMKERNHNIKLQKNIQKVKLEYKCQQDKIESIQNSKKLLQDQIIKMKSDRERDGHFITDLIRQNERMRKLLADSTSRSQTIRDASAHRGRLLVAEREKDQPSCGSKYRQNQIANSSSSPCMQAPSTMLNVEAQKNEKVDKINGHQALQVLKKEKKKHRKRQKSISRSKEPRVRSQEYKSAGRDVSQRSAEINTKTSYAPMNNTKHVMQHSMRFPLHGSGAHPGPGHIRSDHFSQESNNRFRTSMRDSRNLDQKNQMMAGPQDQESQQQQWQQKQTVTTPISQTQQRKASPVIKQRKLFMTAKEQNEQFSENEDKGRVPMHTHRGVVDERVIDKLQVVGASRLRVQDGSQRTIQDILGDAQNADKTRSISNTSLHTRSRQLSPSMALERHLASATNAQELNEQRTEQHIRLAENILSHTKYTPQRQGHANDLAAFTQRTQSNNFNIGENVTIALNSAQLQQANLAKEKSSTVSTTHRIESAQHFQRIPLAHCNQQSSLASSAEQVPFKQVQAPPQHNEHQSRQFEGGNPQYAAAKEQMHPAGVQSPYRGQQLPAKYQEPGSHLVEQHNQLTQSYQNPAIINENAAHQPNSVQNALERHSFQDRNKEVLQQIQEHLNQRNDYTTSQERERSDQVRGQLHDQLDVRMFTMTQTSSLASFDKLAKNSKQSQGLEQQRANEMNCVKKQGQTFVYPPNFQSWTDQGSKKVGARDRKASRNAQQSAGNRELVRQAQSQILCNSNQVKMTPDGHQRQQTYTAQQYKQQEAISLAKMYVKRNHQSNSHVGLQLQAPNGVQVIDEQRANGQWMGQLSNVAQIDSNRGQGSAQPSTDAVNPAIFSFDQQYCNGVYELGAQKPKSHRQRIIQGEGMVEGMPSSQPGPDTLKEGQLIQTNDAMRQKQISDAYEGMGHIRAGQQHHGRNAQSTQFSHASSSQQSHQIQDYQYMHSLRQQQERQQVNLEFK